MINIILTDWPDLLLLFAIGVAQAVQDHLAFRTPWEIGWLSVTWRWRGSRQWYDQLADLLADLIPNAAISKQVRLAIQTIGTNIHTTWSDAWHLMATCKAIAFTALTAHADLERFMLGLLVFVLSFEYALTILKGEQHGKPSKASKVR